MPSNQSRPLFERSDADRLVSVRSIDGPPKYGLTAPPEVTGSRTKLRQAALLALMALAGSLILVLPEPNENSYALSSQQESTIRIAPESGPGAQRFAGSETGEEGDELALASEPEASGPTPRFAEVDTSDIEAEAIRAGSARSTTTEAPAAPATVEDSTTTAEATTTTAKPSETTTVEETADESDAGAGATDDQPTTSVDATTDSSEAETTDSETTDTTAGAADADSEGTTPETTVPAEAETTDPPATDPTETTPPETAPPETAPPADPAYVDAGNGVMVPPVLLAIRFCESTDNYSAANPNSSARGAYQFLTGSWAAYGHKDRYGVNQAHLASPAQQDEAALLTWERDGTRPWNASKSCWSKRI